MASQGENAPGTAESNNAVGTKAWGNYNNIKLEDGVYSNSTNPSGTAYSYYLKATKFGFTIPSGATINGITVRIKRFRAPSSYQVYDNEVKIVKSNGTIGATNYADKTTNWPTSNTSKSYGGSSDLWGETWSYSDINNDNFGVVLSAKLVSSGKMHQGVATVDYFCITITYTAGGGSSAIQSINGLAKASVKEMDGLAVASVKEWNALA